MWGKNELLEQIEFNFQLPKTEAQRRSEKESSKTRLTPEKAAGLCLWCQRDQGPKDAPTFTVNVTSDTCSTSQPSICASVNVKLWNA
jgi:hypothetical protein